MPRCRLAGRRDLEKPGSPSAEEQHRVGGGGGDEWDPDQALGGQGVWVCHCCQVVRSKDRPCYCSHIGSFSTCSCSGWLGLFFCRHFLVRDARISPTLLQGRPFSFSRLLSVFLFFFRETCEAGLWGSSLFLGPGPLWSVTVKGGLGTILLLPVKPLAVTCPAVL